MVQSLSNEIFVARAVSYIEFSSLFLPTVVVSPGKLEISFRANGTIRIFRFGFTKFACKN